MIANVETRPLISLGIDGVTILHNGSKTRVTLSPDKISVGCSDITPEAAKYILSLYTKWYGSCPLIVEIQA